MVEHVGYVLKDVVDVDVKAVAIGEKNIDKARNMH